MANVEKQVEIKSISSEVIFDTFDANLEKKKNKKGHSLTQCLIYGRFIFLKQSVIDETFAIPASFIISNSDSNQPL